MAVVVSDAVAERYTHTQIDNIMETAGLDLKDHPVGTAGAGYGIEPRSKPWATVYLPCTSLRLLCRFCGICQNDSTCSLCELTLARN